MAILDFLKKKPQLKRSEMMQVLGDSGTERFSGYFQEEPNTKWRDDTRADVVEEMRRTDGTVKQILNALKAPLLSATWYIESKDESAEGKAMKEHVEKQLFNLESRTWKEFLREALNYFDFGFSVFEIIWGMKDGKLTIIDLQPRIQRSILKWQINDKSRGINQLIVTDEFEKSNIDIPIEKLLVFTNEMEGDDITGQSMLRSAYKHYYYKDKLYRIAGIASERFGVGIPVVTLPDGAGNTEKSEAEEMAQQLKSNQKAYIVLPNKNWELSILTPQGNPHSDQIDKLIQHHDRMITASVLANFLNLGSGETGSFALSRDQSGFFLKHVEDKASYIAETITKQIIHRMLTEAFREQAIEKYKEGLLPYLTFTPLGDIDFKELSEVLQTLINSGLVRVDTKMIDYVHKTFKLPELTDEDREREDEDDPQEDIEDEFAEKKKLVFWRALTEPEKKVDFAFLEEKYDELEQELESELTGIIKDGVDRGAVRIKNLINSGALASLAALTFLNRSQLKMVIKDVIMSAHEVGKKTAAKELDVDRPANSAKENSIINYDAEFYANQLADNIETQAKEAAKNGYTKEIAIAAVIANLLKKSFDTAANGISNISGTVVGQNINRGRWSVFSRNATLISGYQRSEILDSKTCNICMSLDKRIIEADNPMAQLDLVHTSCRGNWTPLKLEEFPTQKDLIAQGVYGIPKTITDQFETIGGVPIVNSFKQLKSPLNRSNEDVTNELKRRNK